MSSKTSNSTDTSYSQAKQAMFSRLISCIVNESMVETQLVSSSIMSKYQLSNNNKYYGIIYQKHDKLYEEGFIIGLKEMPLINETKNNNQDKIYSIGLLDPQEIQFPLYYFNENKEENIVEINDLDFILNLISKWNQFDMNIVNKVSKELLCSVDHQQYAYLNRQSLLNVQHSKAIDWEQSIVEGHPTHPMNKSRYALPPLQPIELKNNLLNPTIIVCKVPRDQVTINGKYEQVIESLYEELKHEINRETEALIFIHELQMPNILEKFPFVQQLSKKLESKAQAALRTVVLDSIPNYSFKLAVGIKVTSALRTITPWTTHVGPNFRPIYERINDDFENLMVMDEVGSIVSKHEDSDIAKHLSCLIREEIEQKCEQKGEKLIVTAALTEVDSDGISVMKKVLNLNTEAKCIEFFTNYCQKYLKAFATPVYKYGLTYEAHLQNVLCRLKLDNNNNYQITGFAVRDFGGIKVDQTQLKEVTGLQVNVWNSEACQIAKNSEDMHHVAYHTMFMMHLHRVIRSLNLHYNGLGWEIVRNELDQLLPKENCLTRKLWLESPTTDFKAFITMKLGGLYRDYLYTKVPNLISYQIPKDFNMSDSSPNSKFLNR